MVYCNSCVLIGLIGIRAHIPLTTNIVADKCQRKQLGSSNIAILLGVFNETVIPLALVGYEIVYVGYLPSHIQPALVD